MPRKGLAAPILPQGRVAPLKLRVDFELSHQACGDGLAETRWVDCKLRQASGIEDREVSVVARALAIQGSRQGRAICQESGRLFYQALAQVVSASHAEAAHVRLNELHAWAAPHELDKVQGPAGGTFRVLEEDVAAQRDLQLEQAEHEAEMIDGVLQATLELPWGHSEFGQIHYVREVGAHWRSDEELRASSPDQPLGVSAPGRIVEIPRFSSCIRDELVQGPTS